MRKPKSEITAASAWGFRCEMEIRIITVLRWRIWIWIWREISGIGVRCYALRMGVCMYATAHLMCFAKIYFRSFCRKFFKKRFSGFQVLIFIVTNVFISSSVVVKFPFEPILNSFPFYYSCRSYLIWISSLPSVQ